ncbi:MAG: A/G-specific adenine glycosylase [Zoogloeaceae bacterium]|jgi:A/G-specific adenine glycosylase|nr:A/G-specific adenine glycosylase [Zoogloeaceae bacterium]
MDSSFARRVIRWQRQAGRHDLPWQGTHDPYRVWLSEIMLQQTQVATVVDYFLRFLARFPEVRALAAASPEEVLALWAGLGYYARARHLHACARRVVGEYGGQFPSSAAALAELPGIGRSTAAAIAAFAYGERAAILDGNVKRVLCRHFAIEGAPVGAVEKSLWTLAESLLPPLSSAPQITHEEMANYTQGLMDLGATLCLSRTPHCESCPLATSCLARQQGRQESLPAKAPRKAKPCRRAEFLLITDGKEILLQRRPSSGVWGGLLTFPEGREALRLLGQEGHELQPLPPREHVFTHFRLEIHPVVCKVEKMPDMANQPNLECLPLKTALKAGVPAPVARLLEELRNFVSRIPP